MRTIFFTRHPSSAAHDALVFGARVVVDGDFDRNGVVRIAAVLLHARNPILLAGFSIEMVAADAVGSHQRAPAVVNRESGTRERHPADAARNTIDVAVLVL